MKAKVANSLMVIFESLNSQQYLRINVFFMSSKDDNRAAMLYKSYQTTTGITLQSLKLKGQF